ncbi:hypothetical protein NIES2104_32400 [Leptolyngbya sp. NIES-2104]|nr:hypothetical protein NIES2104_32400 [Leptolyngbya sp. NIES-2104]
MDFAYLIDQFALSSAFLLCFTDLSQHKKLARQQFWRFALF